MLGKNSRAVYLNEFLQDQVEDIKKVDFDIFDIAGYSSLWTVVPT